MGLDGELFALPRVDIILGQHSAHWQHINTSACSQISIFWMVVVLDMES